MQKMDFNRGWSVQREGEDVVKTVCLPHDAMIYESRSKDAATAGASGYFREGKYIYRKMLQVPRDWEEKTVLLECEGVYQNAEVQVNGARAAVRPYGYTNFFVDLGSFLTFGAENEITVVADNSKAPNSRWYSGSGMYREAQLYVGPKTCILPEGVKVSVLDQERIRVDVELTGPGAKESDDQLEVEILFEGRKIATAQGNHAEIVIPDVKLWDEEHPDLYQCRVTLKKEGDVADEAAVSFGMRIVTWSGDGFFVNGNPVLLRGACIHHDNGVLGACAFRDAEWRRVKILKEAGFNAIRSAHNPISKAMLDACDALGMYVMDETFDMWIIHKNPYDYGDEAFRQWWKQDVSAMVSKDYNHPSVVMYSIGNEISELGLAEGQEICRQMADFIRDMDKSRAITCGINLMLATMAAKGKGLYGTDKDGKEKQTGSQSMDSVPTSTVFNLMMNKMGGIMHKMASGKAADKVADAVDPFLDIPGYNYATSRYRKELEKHPERTIVGSETLPKSLYRNWQLVKKLPGLVGDFMWTGWDYLGEAGIGTVRYTDRKTKKDTEDGLIVSGGPGVIDICGKMRPEVYWDQIIWGLRKEPAIGVNPYTHARDFQGMSMWRDTDAVESWSWEGCEGEKCDVVVYGAGDHAKLFVNGKCVGKKKIKECKAIFPKVAYEPGSISAAIYDASGWELARTKMRSASGRTQIQLTPEKSVLSANGQDLCFLEIDLTGENGITKSSVDQKLTVAVEGAGVLQAFGSARPHMAEDFVSASHTTYYGKALAVIRAGYEPGNIRVTVSGDGLKTQERILEVVPSETTAI